MSQECIFKKTADTNFIQKELKIGTEPTVAVRIEILK